MSSELDPSRSDPSGTPPPSLAAAGRGARRPRRGRAGTAGSDSNTVMTTVKQETWRLSPGYSRLSPGSSHLAGIAARCLKALIACELSGT